MTTYTFGFLYQLDENGASTNSHVVAQLTNGAGTAVETVDDNTIQMNETFQVSIAGHPELDGTYTYVGHYTDQQGVIGQDVNGDYFYFSNTDAIPVGTNLNSYVAEDLVVCFCAGTMIACPDGERAVETLAAGSVVLTADGRSVAVKWLGRQTVAAPFGMPDGRRPVVITAGALGDDLPVRDLRVTSDHALLIDGVLVQAGALVNGTTVRRIPNAELGNRFMVYHVETENHEVILAEGMPVETFVDNVSRRHFDNYREYEATYGTSPEAIEDLPQPRAMSARQLPRSVRMRLAHRAAALLDGGTKAA